MAVCEPSTSVEREPARSALLFLRFFFFERIEAVRQFVFEQPLLQFFFRDARILARTGIIDQRPSANHQLPGATRHNHDVSKLTLRRFSEDSHLRFNLRKISKSPAPVRDSYSTGIVRRWRWLERRVRPGLSRR